MNATLLRKEACQTQHEGYKVVTACTMQATTGGAVLYLEAAPQVAWQAWPCCIHGACARRTGTHSFVAKHCRSRTFLHGRTILRTRWLLFVVSRYTWEQVGTQA